MLERRKEPRMRMELRVRVSGSDAACEEFSEHVAATNLSRSGALLSKVKVELRCGDLLAIEYDGRQANFRIVWVLDAAAHEGSQVAVHRVGNRPCPWEKILQSAEAVSPCRS
jgi:hypothetical protein